MPVELQPLLRWRMERAHVDAWGGHAPHRAPSSPTLLRRRAAPGPRAGPDRAPATPASRGRPARRGRCGTGTTARSRSSTCSTPARSPRRGGSTSSGCTTCPSGCCPPRSSRRRPRRRADAQRELVRIAARALGVATEPDLRDYFRLPRSPTPSRRSPNSSRRASCCRSRVDGWAPPAYLWHDARRPRRVTARALLSPFDSLIWFRERTERLFGFHYRIEIYTPGAQRRYGYYVLPFLLGDELVGRVDLKSDRQAGVLRVQSAWLEPGRATRRRRRRARRRARAHPRTGSALDGVEVMPRGDLSRGPGRCRSDRTR